MARTHSSHTASPTRFRSPQRSPARHPSQDGSQYEMDLDALGLNSTFESTELEGALEPPVDRLDTSDICGPEDFTMNMTYWMTADLPPAQIKSRKEARVRQSELRMDAMQEGSEEQAATEEGDLVVIEGTSGGPQDQENDSASPTTRINGTTAERDYSTPASDRSMENDEKVRSFLSALPDTDMEGALTGTPLHAPRHSFLQVPRSSPLKPRSLQPTVEDYDTPRKPTQETIIHHTSASVDTSEQHELQDQIAELQSRLAQHELASRTRITELGTILAYTRSELEASRTDNYRYKDKLAELGKDEERRKTEHEAALSLAKAELTNRENMLGVKMRELGEEMRLQNLAKLKSQREDFVRQSKLLEEAKWRADQEVEASGLSLKQVQAELAQLKHSQVQEHQRINDNQSQEKHTEEADSQERQKLINQLASVQVQADAFQKELQQATDDARLAREDTQKKEALLTTTEAIARAHKSRIVDLEGRLQTAHFELECAEADIAAKQQLFNTNLDLNARVRALQSDLETTREKQTLNDQRTSQVADYDLRIKSLQSQFETARLDVATKDEQILQHIESQGQSDRRLSSFQGRIDGLEANIATLRQQLADAHRDVAKSRTDAEQFEQHLEDTKDRLEDTRAEGDRRVADAERKLIKLKEAKVEIETRLKELQSQSEYLTEGHEAMMEDVRDKAEDAVRKAGALLEQERSQKKRLAKDLKKAKEEMETLRAAAQKLTEEEESDEDDDSSSSISRMEVNAKDTEISSLRDIIRTQIAEMKSAKTELATLKKEIRSLHSVSETNLDMQNTVKILEDQLIDLQAENTALETRFTLQEEDFEAVNKAMDERLAALLSSLMKERAKSVVGKRDGQWVESVGKVQTEKELLGKVLLRQWGREEIGVADEKHGERQGYAYKYVQR